MRQVDITSLETAYAAGDKSPSQIIGNVYDQIRAMGTRPIWISLVDEKYNLDRIKEIENTGDCQRLPLFGIPFAVKDNFDVEDLETTAACPKFAYRAKSTAEAVKRLLAAGAILIGKTNLDQFATGLVGVRTPYGVCANVFNESYISGGSSSGSAVSVARGLVSFALGTDTAGSGRVPAAFNQLVGLKPSKGVVSTSGLLPACRSLDCVSVFAETCSDALRVLKVLRGFDEKDIYSRASGPGLGASPWIASSFRFGVPSDDTLEFFGDSSSRDCFFRAVDALIELGGEAVRFDYRPFHAAAQLLYSGPWVAERLAALEEFVKENADEMDPTVRSIVIGARSLNAVDTFKADYRLRGIRRQTDAVMDRVDFLLLPTVPTVYTIAEVQKDPIQLNSNLGYYTNFVNLLDMAAVAVPSGMRNDALPFGVSLIGKAFTEDALLLLADKLHRATTISLGGSKRPLAKTPAIEPPANAHGCIHMAVVGAHLTGQPLNWQMTSRRARLIKAIRTHADYRLFVLSNSKPSKPGLLFDPGSAGPGIELEIWAMPEDTIGTFLDGIPSPLSLGTIILEDGSQVKGFLCEPAGVAGAQEITHLGGWRAYLQSLQ